MKPLTLLVTVLFYTLFSFSEDLTSNKAIYQSLLEHKQEVKTFAKSRQIQKLSEQAFTRFTKKNKLDQQFINLLSQLQWQKNLYLAQNPTKRIEAIYYSDFNYEMSSKTYICEIMLTVYNLVDKSILGNLSIPGLQSDYKLIPGRVVQAEAFCENPDTEAVHLIKSASDFEDIIESKDIDSAYQYLKDFYDN